jgi:hypothetical protein
METTKAREFADLFCLSVVGYEFWEIFDKSGKRFLTNIRPEDWESRAGVLWAHTAYMDYSLGFIDFQSDPALHFDA